MLANALMQWLLLAQILSKLRREFLLISQLVSFFCLLRFAHQQLLIELLSVFNRLRRVNYGPSFTLNYLILLFIELTRIYTLQL